VGRSARVSKPAPQLMGSVAKPRCARVPRCVGYDPEKSQSAKLSQYSQGDFCAQCREKHAAGYRSSRADAWMDKVNGAIETVFAQRPIADSPEKAALWDMFELDSHNGGWKKFSDRGAVLRRLDAKALGKFRDWLDKNKDRAVKHPDYGYYAWVDLRTCVGLSALMAQLPPDMQLLPDTKDLPLQIAAVRTDGKQWDLNLPIRAELLERFPRYFSERNMASLLKMRRTTYQEMRDRMAKRSFRLDRFTSADLWAAVCGEKRGRKSRPEADK
jgi:hypothetical protein